MRQNRSYRTGKGTELPLLSLRGRDYLEVKYRLVWFREEHPEWSIETDLLSVTETTAYARAAIKDEQGRVIATSHKFESKAGFPDFIEKAETGAIGRALALIGYGTQFCADELDEGSRIVDAPVELSRMQPGFSRDSGRDSGRESGSGNGRALAERDRERDAEKTPPPQRGLEGFGEGADLGPSRADISYSDISYSAGTDEASASASSFDPGEYVIGFGKKYRGRKLREIPKHEIEGYVDWLEANAARKGQPLSDEAKYLKSAVGRYLVEGSH